MNERAALLLTALLLLILSWGIARVLLKILFGHAQALGLLDHPGGRKSHLAPTPLIGGLSVVAAVALPCLLGLGIAWLAPAQALPGTWALHLPGLRSRSLQLAAIIGGTLGMLAVGYVDDRRGLSPWTRLALQALGGLLLVCVDVRITLFLPNPIWHGLITIAFVVFLVNAMNFIDNMNGLMAGSAIITASSLLLLAAASAQLFMGAILICLLGGLLSFLPWNYPRARVFMGDAGSLAIGYLLAALTIAFTFDDQGQAFRPLLLPPLFLALPLSDGIFVITSRLRRGIHPFTAGRDHLSHRLVSRGGRPEKVVALLWAGALAFATIGGFAADVPWVWVPMPAILLTAIYLELRRNAKA